IVSDPSQSLLIIRRRESDKPLTLTSSANHHQPANIVSAITSSANVTHKRQVCYLQNKFHQGLQRQLQQEQRQYQLQTDVAVGAHRQCQWSIINQVSLLVMRLLAQTINDDPSPYRLIAHCDELIYLSVAVTTNIVCAAICPASSTLSIVANYLLTDVAD